MTVSTDTADREIKARHRALWASGDYPSVADVIAPLGSRLVDAAGIRAGEAVLDVAAGAGNVAIPAARTGANVIATDLTPELLDVGRHLAAPEHLDITWQTADVEALPMPNAAFDVVTSCVGVMFAPFHQRGADEIARVCRSGGRIGLINWTPTGFIGELFTVMKPYAPAPPPAASAPVLWGDPDHVRTLFGTTITDAEFATEKLVVDRFETGAEFRDFFKDTYGPTIAAFRNIAANRGRVAELDAAMAGLADRYLAGGVMEWEYSLMTAHVR